MSLELQPYATLEFGNRFLRTMSTRRVSLMTALDMGTNGTKTINDWSNGTWPLCPAYDINLHILYIHFEAGHECDKKHQVMVAIANYFFVRVLFSVKAPLLIQLDSEYANFLRVETNWQKHGLEDRGHKTIQLTRTNAITVVQHRL